MIGEEDDDDDGDEDDEDEDQMESSEESEEETEIDYDGIDETKLNLDITAMIAYVSSLTNGRNMFQYKEKILSEQAAWERSNPVKPELDKIFLNKELICCQSAMTDFQTILNTLGGESERERGLRLIERIKVVPDRHSSKTEGLHMSGEILIEINHCWHHSELSVQERSRTGLSPYSPLETVFVSSPSPPTPASSGPLQGRGSTLPW